MPITCLCDAYEKLSKLFIRSSPDMNQMMNITSDDVYYSGRISGEMLHGGGKYNEIRYLIIGAFPEY